MLGGGKPFPPPLDEMAAGIVSRRLHNASKHWVDFRGFLRTPVETATDDKRRCINELASEAVRHQ